MAVMVALGLILVAVLVWIVSNGSRHEGRGSGLRVLDELYASGKITRQEYLERKRVLTGR